MAQYATLKAAIDAVIKANGQREITGTVLNQTLNAMVNSLGADYQFAGVATPSTNPGTPDQNVFYLAGQGGTYSNFNNIVLPDGVSILMWNGSWSSQTVLAGDGGVFDISDYKATGGTLAKFTDLAAAIDGGNNVPVGVRKGGMSIKFIQGTVQSSDNKYIQYRLMAQNFSTTESDWQGVDEEPTAGSENFVKSGGVFESVRNVENYIGKVDLIKNITTGGYVPFVCSFKQGDIISFTLKAEGVLQGDSQTYAFYENSIQGSYFIIKNGQTKNVTIQSNVTQLIAYIAPSAIITDGDIILEYEYLTSLNKRLETLNTEVQHINSIIPEVPQNTFDLGNTWSMTKTVSSSAGRGYIYDSPFTIKKGNAFRIELESNGVLPSLKLTAVYFNGLSSGKYILMKNNTFEDIIATEDITNFALYINQFDSDGDVTLKVTNLNGFKTEVSNTIIINTEVFTDRTQAKAAYLPKPIKSGTTIVLTLHSNGVFDRKNEPVHLYYYPNANPIYLADGEKKEITLTQDLEVLYVYLNTFVQIGYITFDIDIKGTINTSVKENNVVTEKDWIKSNINCSIFDDVAICGDSYSVSQIFEPGGSSNVNFSWGKIFGKISGVNVSLYASGGANTDNWQSRTDCLPKLLSDEPHQMYMICLGINDYTTVTKGTIADLNDNYESNPNTYYGNLGKIICKIKKHAPLAKIVLSTVFIPKLSLSNYYMWSTPAIIEIANYFGIKYIDTYNAQQLLEDDYYYDISQNSAHPSIMGYCKIANSVYNLLNELLYNNQEYYSSFPWGQTISVGNTYSIITSITGTVTWSSGDTSIVTVDSSGKVTAVAAGKVVITATNGTDSVEYKFLIIT